jgi:hypothetical protein
MCQPRASHTGEHPLRSARHQTDQRRDKKSKHGGEPEPKEGQSLFPAHHRFSRHVRLVLLGEAGRTGFAPWAARAALAARRPGPSRHVGRPIDTRTGGLEAVGPSEGGNSRPIAPLGLVDGSHDAPDRGFPWAYTPLLFGSDNKQTWGMLGTMIFLVLGLPGLAVTGIGVSRMRKHRRRQVKEKILDGPWTRHA